MILKQYFLDCLAHASYLVGDEKAGIAAVVDPRRDVDEYLADAAEAGLAIKHVILTHFHADFVASHLYFRNEFGATIHIGAQGTAEYEFAPVHDGDTLQLGDVRLDFLETPGHTPESISTVVTDTAASETPHAVLTGDTLFIGDVGRPDLVASEGVDANTLATALYDSLHNKLLPLPDDTIVYPAHGAGSLCGRNMSTDTFSTMGTQRAYNYALQDMTREEFVAMVTKDQPPAPSYFGWDAQLNRREEPFGGRTVELERLSFEEFLKRAQEGSQVLDARDPVDFAARHMRGAINVGIDGSFAQWAGSVLDLQKPIVLIVYPGGEAEIVTRLARVGIDTVTGFLSSGMQPFEARPDLLESTERVTARNLDELLAAPNPPVVVDVRGPFEWQAGHIAGSINVPLQELQTRLDEIPKDRPFALQCLAGYRSSVAASILLKEGITNFIELTGGIEAWEASKLPTLAGAPSDL
jgi:hydroxyacylglutathione hydrolase